MPKKYTKEEKLKMIKEFSKCPTQKRDILAKKYGYSSKSIMRNSIYHFKKELGIECGPTPVRQEAYFLSDEEKLELFNTWSKSSKKEKEKLAEKYNTTYSKLKYSIRKIRKDLSIFNNNIRYRSDEEKIKILKEYNTVHGIENRKKFCEKYNINFSTVTASMAYYRKLFNINEYRIKTTDEDKLSLVMEWDNSDECEKHLMVDKYNYKNIISLHTSICRFRKLLKFKGLL